MTVDRDGTDVRLLAEKPERGGLRAWNPPRSGTPVDLAACSAGATVPEPETNPGLVRDCETLLEVIGALAGRAQFSWDPETPIHEWRGVSVKVTSARVHKLELGGRGLAGVIPPELGNLSRLESLDLSRNAISGSIPPELGKLSRLETLELGGNYLSGDVPAELGGIPRLGSWSIFGNNLSGCVPGELGPRGPDGEKDDFEGCQPAKAGDAPKDAGSP